jgi:hypothetical protein
MSAEVVQWERLRMAVPHVAMEIQAQRDKYRVLREHALALVGEGGGVTLGLRLRSVSWFGQTPRWHGGCKVTRRRTLSPSRTPNAARPTTTTASSPASTPASASCSTTGCGCWTGG